jgi:hypothetical protein
MNERIKELAEQATVVRKTFYGVEHIEFDKEKFAKLIVEECAGMFADDLCSMRDYTGKACRYMIKDHFGIKE